MTSKKYVKGDNIDLSEIDGIMVYEKGFFDRDKYSIDVKPSEVQDEVEQLSEKAGVSSDYIYDILTPFFSDKEWVLDNLNYIEYEYIDDISLSNKSEDGENMPEEDNKELTEELEKVSQVRDELADKVNKLEEELKEKDNKLQEYKEIVDEYKEKEKNSVINEIVETRKKKGIYSDDDEIDEDKEELSELNSDSLEQVLKETKKLQKVDDKPQPPVSENEEDFQSYNEDDVDKMYEKMFGRKRGE